MKICTQCKTTKEIEHFYLDKRNGKHRSQCIDCMSFNREQRYKSNPEKYKSIAKNYRINNLEKARAASRKSEKQWRINGKQKDPFFNKNNKLIKNFNISIEQYKLLFQNQNESCAICKIHKNNVKKLFAVDHDHKTNKIRGLLCVNCNLMLGLAKDNVEILKNAMEYLSA